MDRELSHKDVRELLGAFALDAVDDDERSAVERHLPYCVPCRTEVSEHLEVTGLLSAAWAPAPEGVWDRIAGTLEETPPAGALSQILPIESGRRSGRRGIGGYRAAVAVASVAAAVIGILGVRVIDTDRQLDQLATTLAGDDLTRASSAAAGAPNARLVAMRGADGGPSADAVLLPDGTGYLLQSTLPPLSRDRTYQLWAVIGDEPISVGLLGSQPTRVAFRASGDVSALAITEEDAGGVARSANAPIVVGSLPT